MLSFRDKTEKLQSVVASLSADETIGKVVSFDPPVPETCMVRGYLRTPVDGCQQALDAVQKRCGIKVLGRVRPVQPDTVAFDEGYRSVFEMVMGENNGKLPLQVFQEGLSKFAAELAKPPQS